MGPCPAHDWGMSAGRGAHGGAHFKVTALRAERWLGDGGLRCWALRRGAAGACGDAGYTGGWPRGGRRGLPRHVDPEAPRPAGREMAKGEEAWPCSPWSRWAGARR